MRKNSKKKNKRNGRLFVLAPSLLPDPGKPNQDEEK